MAIRRRGHIDRVNAFIVVWCGDEPEQVGFDGEVFNLPPMDVKAETGKGAIYKFEGARDRSGDIIPGTVLVTDRNAIIEGNRVKVFDADMFVKWVEAIRPDLGDRGLMIVDLPEEVDDAKAQGRPLFEKSQDARARKVLENELFRRRKWEEKGTPAPPSSSEHLVAWAIKHLNERGTALSTIQTDQIVGALSKGSSLPPRSTLERAIGRPGPAKPVAPDGAVLYAKAKALGVKMVKDELEGLLSNEAEAIESVGEKVAEAELRLKEMEEAASAPA